MNYNKWYPLIGIIVLIIILYFWNTSNNTNEPFLNIFTSEPTNELIHNGSFAGGKDITEMIKTDGDNQIIVKPNPGKTSYVLMQSGNASYQLAVPIEPNEYYKLTSWSFGQLNYIVSVKSPQFQQVNLLTRQNNVRRDPNGWTYTECLFKTPMKADMADEMRLYITFNNTSGVVYYTDIGLKHYLKDAPDFNIGTGLRAYLSNVNMGNQIWKDLSGRGNDFTWQQRPQSNQITSTLVGPPAKQMLTDNDNNSFSIVIRSQNLSTPPPMKNIETPEMNVQPPLLETLELNDYQEVLRIPGNNKDALRVFFPIEYGPMRLHVSDIVLETNKSVLTQNLNTYFFEYDADKNLLEIYVNNAMFYSGTPDNKLYLTDGPVEINGAKNWNAHLYDLLTYNRPLNANERAYLNKYLSRETMQSSQQSPITTQPIITQQPMPISTSTMMTLNQPNKPLMNVDKKGECPDVKYERGQFWVGLQKGSKLAERHGYCGYKSYGGHQGSALKMYQTNFPDCIIPHILRTPVRHQNFKYCPYIIRENNPCFTEACASVDWKNLDGSGRGVSKQCMRNINNYCEMNGEIDPNCQCWSRQNKNTPECIKHRKKFVDPRDYGCQVDVFNIEDHPNMKDYIRKDRIPCWGCDLS